jgi:hypothetical protein
LQVTGCDLRALDSWRMTAISGPTVVRIRAPGCVEAELASGDVVMSRLNSAVVVAVLVAVVGCAGEDQDPVPPATAPTNPPPPGGMMLPTGMTPGQPTTPPTTPPVATVDAGMPPSAADAGAMPPRDAGMMAMDAGMMAMDAGMMATMDAGMMPTMPGNTGPLNMAPVVFGKNVKVNDDTGKAQ